MFAMSPWVVMWLIFVRERSSSTRQWWPEPVVCSVVCVCVYVCECECECGCECECECECECVCVCVCVGVSVWVWVCECVCVSEVWVGGGLKQNNENCEDCLTDQSIYRISISPVFMKYCRVLFHATLWPYSYIATLVHTGMVSHL